LTTFEACYLDGRSSSAQAVQVTIDDDAQVWVRGAGLELRYPLSDVTISPRLGSTLRSITLPGGARCETTDNDTVDRAAAIHRVGRLGRGLHVVESRLPLVAGALVATLLLGWATIEYGVPSLARHLAMVVPQQIDQKLGREALGFLDEAIFEPSQLETPIRTRLRARFNELTEATRAASATRLVFRASPAIGANALALPSGIVVMTDELVRLAAHEDEVAAVLAHELGHVHGRHALRSILQHSTTVALIAAATGDLTSLGALSATLPTLLVELKYSRTFEREADDYAAALLPRFGIPPDRLAAMLRRLEGEASGHDNGLFGYLSTHPATEERIRRLTDRAD
jgi:Zn-dependent protease with chaperone function